jgi:Ca2+-binding RTX toxin-like protein
LRGVIKMADFTGTAGKDTITGTADPDTFDMTQGGNDRVKGLGGNDLFNFGAALTGKDKVDGGNGYDLVAIDGDYSAGVVFGDESLIGVDEIELAGGHSYTLKFADANFKNFFAVDGRDLGAGDALVVDLRDDTDGITSTFGGAGNDLMRGGGGSDAFILTRGGADTATGGDGSDAFAMGAAFGTDDRLDGGAGQDAVSLTGNYAAGFTITKQMMKGVELVLLKGAFNYDLSLDNQVAGAGIAIDASALAAGNRAIVDGHREKAASVTFTGSGGDDRFTGGDKNDSASFSLGGDDRAEGGSGNDSFNFGATFDSNDRIDGGAGFDSVITSSDFSGGFTLDASFIQSIEQITLLAGHSYDLDANDNAVAAGATLAITATGLLGAQTLTFDGTAETDGDYSVAGGGGNDTLDGGAGDDTLGGSAGDDVLTGHDGDDTLAGGDDDDLLIGGAGSDRMSGGSEADTFVYSALSESTGAGRDTLVFFQAAKVVDEETVVVDVIDVPVAVTDIDDVVNDGELSEATFDTDLAAAIGAGELGASHAVIFVAEDGDLVDHSFLIVDANGTAGYQAGEDFVMELDGGVALSLLAIENFI